MSALSFCRRQLPGRMGLFVESQLWNSSLLIQPKQAVVIALSSSFTRRMLRDNGNPLETANAGHTNSLHVWFHSASAPFAARITWKIAVGVWVSVGFFSAKIVEIKAGLKKKKLQLLLKQLCCQQRAHRGRGEQFLCFFLAATSPQEAQ